MDIKREIRILVERAEDTCKTNEMTEEFYSLFCSKMEEGLEKLKESARTLTSKGAEEFMIREIDKIKIEFGIELGEMPHRAGDKNKCPTCEAMRKLAGLGKKVEE